MVLFGAYWSQIPGGDLSGELQNRSTVARKRLAQLNRFPNLLSQSAYSGLESLINLDSIRVRLDFLRDSSSLRGSFQNVFREQALGKIESDPRCTSACVAQS